MSSRTPVPLRAGGLRCGRFTTSAGDPVRRLGPGLAIPARAVGLPARIQEVNEMTSPVQRMPCQTIRRMRLSRLPGRSIVCMRSPSLCLPFDDDPASARLVVSPARHPRDTGTPRKRLPPRYTYSSGSASERHRSRRRWTMPGQDRARPGRRGGPVRPSGETRGPLLRRSPETARPSRYRMPRFVCLGMAGVRNIGTIRGLSRPGSEGPWMTGTR